MAREFAKLNQINLFDLAAAFLNIEHNIKWTKNTLRISPQYNFSYPGKNQKNNPVQPRYRQALQHNSSSIMYHINYTECSLQIFLDDILKHVNDIAAE